MRSLTVALILATLSLVTRPSIAPAQPTTQTIRQQIATINRTLPQFKKSEKELTGMDEGGYLIVWRNDNHVVKVIEWLGLSNNNLQTIYYFHNRQLICVKEERQYFLLNEVHGNLDRTKPGHRTVATYYFHKRRLIQYAGEGKGQTASTILKNAAFTLRLAAAPGKSLHLHDF